MSSPDTTVYTENAHRDREFELRRQIEEYYLPKQLVDAIIEIGGIPTTSVVTQMGIGFLDVADYTFLSKFLSPQENQAVLNGLYTAFNSVLRRHGGYLNKLEGDSLMFHYGGIIDRRAKELEHDQEALRRYIARELFYTCIEMQRVSVLFNQANDKFLYESETQETRRVLERAFEIISVLRSGSELSPSFNALFQIRIRIGANIGNVTLGNFGPDGAKQWDVIGLPVIDAKRMESTAPVGGLRISEEFYNVLEETGIADAYYSRFKKEAQALFGYYRDITKEELFQFNTVFLKDKKNASFKTYSIQVNPGLPESIMAQVELLLEKGEIGADKILELMQYYRGNKFVTDALEEVFRKRDIRIRKSFIFETIYPKRYEALVKRFDGDEAKIHGYLEEKWSLYRLFEKLGKYQDTIKAGSGSQEKGEGFVNYQSYIEDESQRILSAFERSKRSMIQKAYFYNVVYPLVFASIRTSILEYQAAASELQAV